METVLITGGTGMVGTRLTNVLLARGYKVIVLSRSHLKKTGHKNLSYALWDVKKREIDMAAVGAADHLIHLAGAGVVDKKWTPAYKKEIMESRTESARLLIDALKKNNDHHPNKIKTVVSASAIGWYGADKDPVKSFNETDESSPDFLGTTCKLWEKSMEPVTWLGKRLVTLRIGIVLSNDGGALAEFKKPLRFGLATILGTGKQIISWIHIDDLCNLFIAAIENEKMQGVYNAVAPQPVSNKTLMLTLAKMMHGKFYIPIPVPTFVLKLMMGQRSIEVLKSTRVSAEKITATGFTYVYETIDAALANLVKK
ncbi:MAG: TIGR01777 family oxidoreductase [Ferruginibacter sp.]